MRTKLIVLLLVVIACWCSFPRKENPVTASQRRISDTGFCSHSNASQFPWWGIKHDLPEIEHLFTEWEAARAKGDKAEEKISHELISLEAASHESWLRKFYKYGVENPSLLDPEEKKEWKIVGVILEGRKQKLSADDYFKIDPPQIRAMYVEERKAFGFQDAPVSATSPTNLH